jgi:hypothetical protein
MSASIRLAVVLGLVLASAAAAQPVAKEEFPLAERSYSPNVDQSVPNRVFWGDTHLHTSFSTDAGMLGCRIGPDEAYRFARGEEVRSNSGQRVKLSRPLDFLVVADHSENLGLAPMIASSDPLLMQNPTGKRWHDMVKAGQGFEAFGEWIKRGSTEGKDPIDSPEMARSAWAYIVEAAERFNQPGSFTALIGYEWTSTPAGNNLHRNVIFRDGGDRAGRVLPLTSYESPDPEQLWKWMAAYEEKTGGRVLAIPHNGNLSNGMMWQTERLNGGSFDRDYARTRAKREPLVEITQPKGTSETHPALAPTDEFADFEIWDKSNLGGNVATAKEMLPKSYVRPALLAGLALDAKLGANPFKFGLLGSTDAHTGLSSIAEDNFFGKTPSTEPSAKRWDHAVIPAIQPELVTKAWALGASGLAAVWARENTRAALFDAMERREVYWNDRHAHGRARVRGVRLHGRGRGAPRLRRPGLCARRADGWRSARGAEGRRAGVRNPRAARSRRRESSTACRWSRAGSTRRARRTSGSSTSRCRTAARSAPTAAARRPWAAPSTSRTRATRIRSDRCCSMRSGWTRASTRSSARSTTCACSRSRRRAGPPMTRSSMASRCRPRCR